MRRFDGTESRKEDRGQPVFQVRTCPYSSAEWTSELQGERRRKRLKQASNPRRSCHRYQGKGYRWIVAAVPDE